MLFLEPFEGDHTVCKQEAVPLAPVCVCLVTPLPELGLAVHKDEPDFQLWIMFLDRNHLGSGTTVKVPFSLYDDTIRQNKVRIVVPFQ